MATSLLDVQEHNSGDAIGTLIDLLQGSSLDAILRGAGGYKLVGELTSLGALTVAEHPALINASAERLSAGGRSRITWMVRALVLDDRGVLASASDAVLSKLDGCSLTLLASLGCVFRDAMRQRICEAIDLLAAAKSEGLSVHSYASTESMLEHLPGTPSRLLACCIEGLRARDLVELVNRWVATLGPSDFGKDAEPMLAGFGNCVARGKEAELAVLEEGAAHAVQMLSKRVGRPNVPPDEYLSPTEWAQLEPLIPEPTARRSGAHLGGRPVLSNKSLAAGLVCAFEMGATPDTIFATWRRLPSVWVERKLVCRRTTLQRRLKQLDSALGGRAALLGAVAEIAVVRRRALIGI
jgi:hypothetical protein